MMTPAYPWFGGKRRAASEIWGRLGDVSAYIEPFFGGGSVLLARPHAPRYELINDIDCQVANFWRSVRRHPARVVDVADWPMCEADLRARLAAVRSRSPSLREEIEGDPNYCDPALAGMWVWCVCVAIGGARSVESGEKGTITQDHFGGMLARRDLADYVARLSERMRRVFVLCVDWSRALSSVAMSRHGDCGIVLDPPYGSGSFEYAGGVDARQGAEISAAVREWAIEHGHDRRLRVALCGYEGDHEMPSGWSIYRWSAVGGYANQGAAKGGRRREEVIWFSPGCLAASQMSLF